MAILRSTPTFRRLFCTSSESSYRSLAKATLIGRTGAPAEVYEDSYRPGRSTAMLPIATTSPGGMTNWFRVYISDDATGYSLIEQVPKGTRMYVEGSLRIRTVERDGVEKQYINVQVSGRNGMFRILDYGRSNEGTSNEEDDESLPF